MNRLEILIKTSVCKNIQKYYETHSTGGNLHIVLDDGNLRDSDIKFCMINNIKENDDEEGHQIGMLLLELTLEEREKLYDNNWNYSCLDHINKK